MPSCFAWRMWLGIDRLLLILSLVILSVNSAFRPSFTNQWAVRVNNGSEETARLIASHYGFVYVARILEDYFLFRHPRVSKRSVKKNMEHLTPLETDSKVSWVQQQVAKRRVKREIHFNDHKWPRMWYLKGGSILNMKVSSAWERGYTGQGVVVSILDDGIEKDHPDLRKNYDQRASYDVNDQDDDPQPRYDLRNENRHGTRCAGEVAAEANNGICSVGVAFNANIGGVRMLDGEVTDAVEAQSLNLQPQHIHIFSASWGPDDDGKTVDGPGPLARKAFLDGILHGRKNLGSIFVWASGNGGREGDGCNCDGYTNSIYTLSISSTTENGEVPWYSEPCASTLATTFSSGSNAEKQIVTTDLHKGCTESHTGTSASAPLAAGIAALVLQANPRLTWRDLQYIVVMTSRPDGLRSEDWKTNGVGRRVSHYFGYGLLDISTMIDVAKNWTNVPDQRRCEITSKETPRVLQMNELLVSTITSDGCSSEGSSRSVGFLEHVQAIVTLSSTCRGEVEINLTSPSGTKSVLLKKRTKDVSSDGFSSWAFMTTHSWGEGSSGVWKLEVKSHNSLIKLQDWSLVLYGTNSYWWSPPTIPTAPPRRLKDRRATVKGWALASYGVPTYVPDFNNNRKKHKHPYHRDYYYSKATSLSEPWSTLRTLSPLLLLSLTIFTLITSSPVAAFTFPLRLLLEVHLSSS